MFLMYILKYNINNNHNKKKTALHETYLQLGIVWAGQSI